MDSNKPIEDMVNWIGLYWRGVFVCWTAYIVAEVPMQRISFNGPTLVKPSAADHFLKWRAETHVTDAL